MTLPSGVATGGRALDHAFELAPHVYWVGSVLPGDEFQCHVYLVENGTDSVLIDPGSPLTMTETLRKVEEVVPLSHVRWLVCHHADPDVAAALPALRPLITRPDAMVVTEWRAEALLRHYDAGFPFYLVEEHDWQLDLGAGRSLGFQLTPYLHFPGAMVSHDSTTGVLFSADIFGGFVIDPSELVATDAEAAFDVVRLFHQHYMPSRELLSTGLRRIRRRFPDISLIAPQHGSVIPGPLVDEMFRRLDVLECGIFQFASEDLDLSRLLQLAEARERLYATLLSGRTVDAVATGLIANPLLAPPRRGRRTVFPCVRRRVAANRPAHRHPRGAGGSAAGEHQPEAVHVGDPRPAGRPTRPAPGVRGERRLRRRSAAGRPQADASDDGRQPGQYPHSG